MIWNHNIPVGAGTGKGVVDFVIAPCRTKAIKRSTGGVVTVKENNERQFSCESIGNVYPRPYINGDGSNIRVENTGGFVFKGVNSDARIGASRIGCNLRPSGRRQQQG